MLFKPVATTCALYCVLLVPIQAEPVAVVNGEIITQQHYNDYLAARAQQNSSNKDAPRERIIQEIIQRILIKQDALKNGIDKGDEFKLKLKALHNSLLMSMGMQKHLEQHPVDEATLKSEYDKQIVNITVPPEYKVRHIFVKTEDYAKAIIRELDAGKTFGELAKAKSMDTGSANKDGDLGWVTAKKVVPSFAKALEKLENGTYTGLPIQSQFGWHVIQVDDSRVTLPSFESVKDRIKAALQFQVMQEYVINLRNQATIEISKPTP